MYKSYKFYKSVSQNGFYRQKGGFVRNGHISSTCIHQCQSILNNVTGKFNQYEFTHVLMYIVGFSSLSRNFMYMT